MSHPSSQQHEAPFSQPPDLGMMAEAPLLAQRARVEAELAGRELRALRGGEIEALREQGNSAEDWSRVRVHPDFDPRFVQFSRFEGRVDLGCFGRSGGTGGIYHSTLRDCMLGDEVRIARCGRVARQTIGSGAVIEDVNRIELKGESSVFGNDLVLFDEELFSRRTPVVAEIPFAWMVWLSGPGAAVAEVRGPYEETLKARTGDMRSKCGFVGEGVRIASSSVIENCWIGQNVEVEGGGSLRNCTVWGASGAETSLRDGVHARNCLIGPGCVIERGATLEDSIFFEQVFAGQQAIVRGCAVGANSRLSASEANDSLLGPFTMAIHHGLILAAWWPEGKGNIAYGANVGSNHTGRAPDQEIFPGEGLFFGLGCNVKFPCNFQGAPYTIIASGVNMLPQKMDFPFSLVTEPTRTLAALSPALNEIQPGWVLLQNAYGVERQERNMAQRNRARREWVETRILRPEMLPLLRRALAILERFSGDDREIFSEREMPALGKNFMSREALVQGIEAYRLGMAVIAARALRTATEDTSAREVREWCACLGCEPNSGAVGAAVEALGRRWVGLVKQSRIRDEKRGRMILPDYHARHLEFSRDPTVKAVEEEWTAYGREAVGIVARLPGMD